MALFVLLNRGQGVKYERLSDSVAYLDLRTFELDEMQEDSIRTIFAQIVADSVEKGV